MPRNSSQKQKLLYLQKILLEKTDEEHPLTLAEIREQLLSYGISTERKALYSDIEALEQFGLDICRVRSKSVGYYIGSRDFELPELKLLVDAIQSSKFITRKKSLSLIKKLEGLLSENQGKQLQRQVFVANRVKNVNEKIYYNVDRLYGAISENRQISFKYYTLELQFGNSQKIVKKERRAGKSYVVSPWALCWDDENYYLVAYDETAQILKHYRVDKMEKIQILSDNRLGSEKFKDFDIAHYTKGMFSMFGGEETEIKLSVDNSLVGVIADRFGSDVFISKESETSFCVTVNVMLSPQFYAWIFGLGNKVKILAPKKAQDEFKKQIRNVSEQYEFS